ncbi:hypothetical protein CBM2634_P30065 [Cupriavidus taiwanensis]|uniref:Uncharacterized protein n=1 Tax=Cupriavidus taiwanensis TaxID=164546 RepID=A0A375JCN3_9BURK|nr:hypothetical protein CBM2634_P30065 [Cupriavidus taiwanensis]
MPSTWPRKLCHFAELSIFVASAFNANERTRLLMTILAISHAERWRRRITLRMLRI